MPLLHGCSRDAQAPGGESSSAGTLDPPSPIPTADELALEWLREGRFIGEVRSPRDAAAQRLAYLADEVAAYRSVDSDWGEFLTLYLRARSAGLPGLCHADVLTFSPPRPRHANVEPFSLYAVAGSLAPLPGGWREQYGRRLDQVCSRRRDMRTWFKSPDARTAWRSARVVDVAVSAAKAGGPLPFRLWCEKEPGRRERQCLDPRALLASLNPRQIAEARLEPCPLPRAGHFCATIGIAHGPGYWAGDLRTWQLAVNAVFDERPERGDGGMVIQTIGIAYQRVIVG